MNSISSLAKFLKARSQELSNMNHLETQEIVSGIYIIKTKDANFYIIKADDGYIAIDAGSGNKRLVKAELSKLSIEPEKVTAVLLTHSDIDHTAALSLFKNAKVYVSKEEVKLIDGSILRFGIVKNKLKCSYHIINNYEEMSFGDVKIKPILSPGHTVGSMSYIINDKYLFVGDALSIKDGKPASMTPAFNMDDEACKHSCEKLLDIKDIEYIFTAHYGVINKACELYNIKE